MIKRSIIPPNISGIYQIQSTIDSKSYVGSSKNLRYRKQDHFRNLEKSIHSNPVLQNYYNKYGVKNLLFFVLQFCKEDDLIKQEQHWIDTLHPEFNIAKVANAPMKGRFHTKETKKKQAEASKGNNNAAGLHKSYIYDPQNSHRGMTGKHHSTLIKWRMSKPHLTYCRGKS